MVLNIPSDGRAWQDGSLPPSTPHFVAMDPVETNTRRLVDAIETESRKAEAHRRQTLADTAVSRGRGEQAIRIARWTLLVSALTLLVALATLIASVILA